MKSLQPQVRWGELKRAESPATPTVNPVQRIPTAVAGTAGEPPAIIAVCAMIRPQLEDTIVEIEPASRGGRRDCISRGLPGSAARALCQSGLARRIAQVDPNTG
jgi:hypothetical protein